MAYYLDPNNCHITYNKLNFSIISQFLDIFIFLINEEEYIEIQCFFSLFQMLSTQVYHYSFF